MQTTCDHVAHVLRHAVALGCFLSGDERSTLQY